MDKHLLNRLLLALGVTGVASVVVALSFALLGRSAGSINDLWPYPLSLFALVFLGVELSGRFRSPRDKFDKTLEDDWDR